MRKKIHLNAFLSGKYPGDCTYHEAEALARENEMQTERSYRSGNQRQ